MVGSSLDGSPVGKFRNNTWAYPPLSFPYTMLPVAHCHGTPDAKVKHESPVAKMFISAITAWVFELGIGHYIEVQKISKQATNLSYMGIHRNLVGTKGYAGILDGFFPWGTLQAIAKGGSFGLGHSAAKSGFRSIGWTDKYPKMSEVMAGGIGGFIQGIVLNPVLLLKTRVVTDPAYRASGGVWETARMSTDVGFQVIKREGVMGLTTGGLMFTSKRFFDWTTRFLFVEMMESIFKGGDDSVKLSKPTQYTAALCGGALSAISTVPMDVMVAVQQSAGAANKNVSTVDLFKEKYAKGGMNGILQFGTKGLVARIAHVGLTTLVMKSMASEFYVLYSKAVYGDDD